MKVLNEEYPIERFDRFFTIFYLIIDPSTGHFKYSSGGHPPAVILKKNNQLKLLDQGGAFIGLKKLLSEEDLIPFIKNNFVNLAEITDRFLTIISKLISLNISEK